QFFHQGIINVPGTFYITRRAKTDRNPVSSLGIQGELGVKRSHTIDLFHRNYCLIRDHLLHLNRKITVYILCLLQDRHKGTFFIFEIRDHFHKCLFLFFCPGKWNCSFLSCHSSTSISLHSDHFWSTSIFCAYYVYNSTRYYKIPLVYYI